jgi:hypothetical protein
MLPNIFIFKKKKLKLSTSKVSKNLRLPRHVMLGVGRDGTDRGFRFIISLEDVSLYEAPIPYKEQQ